jgi:EmrB/QacA subfamily drug resistance transporter
LSSSTAQQDEVVAGVAERKTAARWSLVSLALTMLMSSLGTSIANVALPTLVKTFSLTFQDVQWVVLAYLLATTTLIVSAGRLGDLTGRRRLILAGLFLFTFASMLCGVASTFWLLVAARAVQGLGAAIMMALTMACVSEAVPKEKIGRAMGLLGTMSAIGTALGPSLGGLLIASLGWRSIFFINLPLGLLTWFLAWRYLPLDHTLIKADRPRFDHLGTLLLALTLAAYALGMTMGHGNFTVINIVFLLAAALGVSLFLLVEARAASPLIRLDIFRNLLLSAGFATSALVATVMMATLVVGPFYLTGALKLGAAALGLVMSSGPIISALTGVPAGRMVDRFGSLPISIVGLVGMLIGTAILSIVPTSFGIPGYIAPLIFTTAGYGLFQAANNTAVMANICADQRGVVSGMLNLSRNLGLITGVSVMGAVFTFGSATTKVATASAETVAAGMHFTFAVAAALTVIALLISLLNSGALTALTPKKY